MTEFIGHYMTVHLKRDEERIVGVLTNVTDHGVTVRTGGFGALVPRIAYILWKQVRWCDIEESKLP